MSRTRISRVKITRVWLTLGSTVMLVGSQPAALASEGTKQNDSRTDSGQGGVSTSMTGENDWYLWFFVSEEYRLRVSISPDGGGNLTNPVAGSESDHDLRLFLDVGVRDPSDRFGAQAALGLWWDMDGSIPEGEPSGLGSLYDYRQPWWDVFKLQADYRSSGYLRLARAGRLASEHGLPVTFDGVSFLVTGVRPFLDLFLFGGRSVHFFETQVDTFEDWIASAGAVIRPMPSIRLELDYRFVQEDVLQLDRKTKRDLNDHLYGLSAWFRHSDWLYARVYTRGLNDSVSHTGASAKLAFPSLGLGANLVLDAQVIGLKEINEREDPYFTILGESLPHLRWQVDLWKMFETAAGEYAVHAGWNGRDLLEGVEGPFNRNVGRIYILFEATDIVLKGPFAGLAAEGHYSHAGGQLSHEMIYTAGGSAGYATTKLKVEAGSYYQRYKYDYYRDLREIDDVRTFFGTFSYKLLGWLTLRARYEFEQSDRDFHTVTLALSQTY